MTKADNIKKYYTNKLINNRIQLSKLTGEQIRRERDNTLKNQLWETAISRITKTYKVLNLQRTISYERLLGCDIDMFYEYLDDLCKKSNLLTESYPEWEMDHIKPISKFDLSNVNNQLECFNYHNIQPLLKLLNRQKYNK